MARFTAENEALAREIIARYPVAKSATIPLCHLAQEQEGHLSTEAMAQIAELVGATEAEILGTASFYEMFKRHEVGTYCINVCTSISCFLRGSDELLHHAEETLGVRSGGTTDDGLFTLEGWECIAACTAAPAIQVNYRYVHDVTPESFDALVEDLRAGRTGDEFPPHGTLGRVRQHLVAETTAGPADPRRNVEPAWLTAAGPALGDGGPTTPAPPPPDENGATP